MKALILAAGLGTRLRPLTEHTPKPLLPIGKHALLYYHLRSLHDFGVTSVLINTHYLAPQIDDFVEKAKSLFPGMSISTKFEAKLTGGAHTLKENEDFFKGCEDFLVVYGDNLTNINYANLVAEHEKKGGVVTIACYYEEHPESKGIINFDENGKILSFVEKPKKEQITSNWANAGMYCLNKKIFTYLHKIDSFPLDFGHHIFPYLLQAGEDMHIYKMSETILDIGTPESYNEAQQLVKELFKDD